MESVNLIEILAIFIILFNPLNGQRVKNENEYCPPCDSSFVCLSSITEEQCDYGEFLVPNIGVCGCCPGCKGGVKLGLSCNDNNANLRCAPGLKCVDLKCALDKSTCKFTQHLDTSMVNVLPTCDLDGTYTAVQCKGDRSSGRCFCYNSKGERIFGSSWWREAADMTCACSRRRAELEEAGRVDVTLHCSQNGNFEELECDSGICWCAEPKTGRLQAGTTILPDTLWTLLPCYNVTLHGVKYLRQCESGAYAQNLMRKTLGQHGTTYVSFNNIQCHYDGTYGTFIIKNGIVNCMWRDGTTIGSFADNSNLVSRMNCYCARDQKIFDELGMTLTLYCGNNGNYNTIQDINGKIFCVDNDGFAVSGYYDNLESVDCSKHLYYS